MGLPLNGFQFQIPYQKKTEKINKQQNEYCDICQSIEQEKRKHLNNRQMHRPTTQTGDVHTCTLRLAELRSIKHTALPQLKKNSQSSAEWKWRRRRASINRKNSDNKAVNLWNVSHFVLVFHKRKNYTLKFRLTSSLSHSDSLLFSANFFSALRLLYTLHRMYLFRFRLRPFLVVSIRIDFSRSFSRGT